MWLMNLALIMKELKKDSPNWAEIDVWVKSMTRRTRDEVALGRKFFKKKPVDVKP